MITGRRAQQFQDLVEGTLDRGRTPPRTPTCSTSWARCGRCPHRSPDPAFVAALRERLLAEAADGAGRPPRRRARPTPASGSGCDPPPPAHPAPPPPARGRHQRRRPRRASGDRWRWPPRAPCRATGSTRSSAASRAPTPSSPSTAPPAAGSCSTTPRRGSTRSPSSAATGASADQVGRDPRRVHAGGGRRLRPADRRLPGDRRPVVDDHRPHLHRDEHGAAARAPGRRPRRLRRPAAAGGPGARPGAAGRGPRLPDLRRARP